ncbi:MAG TPA: hypothetical protein VG167_16710, partial [Verrucomicrobiae bacterium]|nr:hypothetical protein [Verrucomicrobiae bacterium]
LGHFLEDDLALLDEFAHAAKYCLVTRHLQAKKQPKLRGNNYFVLHPVAERRLRVVPDGKKSRARAKKDQPRPRAKRRRKVPLRAQPGRHARRTVADAPEFSALPGLIQALGAEKIRFIVVGMTAAVLQGTPVTTFDLDLWIDLPPL